MIWLSNGPYLDAQGTLYVGLVLGLMGLVSHLLMGAYRDANGTHKVTMYGASCGLLWGLIRDTHGTYQKTEHPTMPWVPRGHNLA